MRHIIDQPPVANKDGPIALVLCPTRELAMQIYEECIKYSKFFQIRSACVYGGASRKDQYRELNNCPHIVIATPGRLIDFVETKALSLNRVTYLVLDEADRMLDMGFEPQIRSLMSQIRPDRQLLM